jgi:hypothetical protein
VLPVAKARDFERLAPLCFLFLAKYQGVSIDLHLSDVMADMIGYGRPKRPRHLAQAVEVLADFLILKTRCS